MRTYGRPNTLRKTVTAFLLSALLATQWHAFGEHSPASDIGPVPRSGEDIVSTSGRFETTANSEGNTLVELYENNGPDGDAGVPMQRLSSSGLVFAIALMLFSSLVLLLGGRKHPQQARS
jgi:hypothetical protein